MTALTPRVCWPHPLSWAAVFISCVAGQRRLASSINLLRAIGVLSARLPTPGKLYVQLSPPTGLLAACQLLRRWCLAVIAITLASSFKARGTSLLPAPVSIRR